MKLSRGDGGPDLYSVWDQLERRPVTSFTREPLAAACARRLSAEDAARRARAAEVRR